MKKTICKVIAGIMLLVIALGIVNTAVFAETNNDITFSTALVTSKKQVIPGEEFEVNFNVSDLSNIERGIIALGGTLEYSKEVLELEEISSQNDWSRPEYNTTNGKFVVDRNEFLTSNSSVLKLKFKVSENIEQAVNTNIVISNIVVSNGRRDIFSNNSQLEISVKPEEEILISSEKYLVEEQIISKIAPTTTFAEFKANVVSNETLVIVDKNGNEITDETVLGTGMKLKVGDKAEYTLSVIADLDENSEITLTDLAKLKLHLIEKELLISDIEIKAADLDNNGKIDLVDLAQMKLYLVGKLVIEK